MLLALEVAGTLPLKPPIPPLLLLLLLLLVLLLNRPL
jgi:hypothetical protein